MCPLFGKDSDAGRDWWQEEKGTTEMRWLDGITDSMDMSLLENDRNFRLPLGLALGRPIFHSNCEGELEVADHLGSTELQLVLGRV